MSKLTVKVLREAVIHLEYYNNMAPFPVYSTEYIGDIKQKIKDMEENKTDYDELPVAACKHCNNLYLEVDDVQNDICMRCGSVNDITIYKDIYEYLDKIKEDEE